MVTFSLLFTRLTAGRFSRRLFSCGYDQSLEHGVGKWKTFCRSSSARLSRAWLLFWKKFWSGQDSVLLLSIRTLPIHRKYTSRTLALIPSLDLQRPLSHHRSPS